MMEQIYHFLNPWFTVWLAKGLVQSLNKWVLDLQPLHLECTNHKIQDIKYIMKFINMALFQHLCAKFHHT